MHGNKQVISGEGFLSVLPLSYVIFQLLRFPLYFQPRILSIYTAKMGAEMESGLVDVSRIYGKIQIVDNFADYKVEIVNSFADLHVEIVTHFANKPGKWQIVSSFPDYKIQLVDHFPDFKVRYVNHFPGVT